MPVGVGLTVVPGPRIQAVIGMMTVGLAMGGLYGLLSRSAFPRTDPVGCPVGHYVW